MKKNIIIGFHNPYLILENLELISKIGKLGNVYLISTNRYLTKSDKARILQLKKKKIIKDYVIFYRYFANSNNLNLFSIFFNYFYILKKIKSLSKIAIHLCILGSNVFMWERIITEKVINKDCKLLIYQPDMLTLPLITIKELYSNLPIKNIISKIHKSRQIKINKKNISKDSINIMNIINKKIDLFDRIILGKIFFRKKFTYRKLDTNIWMDTEKTRIDSIFTYFKTLKIYWKKIYPKVKVKLISKYSDCKCKSINWKKKILLLGDDIEFPKEIQRENFTSLKRDIDIILSQDSKNITQIDIKPHPGSLDKNNFILKEFLKNKFNNIQINLLNKSTLLEQISCSYKIAIGAFGTGLFKIAQSCNYCKVIGLTSQSKNYYIMNGEDGKNCWLKVKNTGIGIIKDDGSFSINTFKRQKRKKNFKTFFYEIVKYL